MTRDSLTRLTCDRRSPSLGSCSRYKYLTEPMQEITYFFLDGHHRFHCIITQHLIIDLLATVYSTKQKLAPHCLSVESELLFCGIHCSRYSINLSFIGAYSFRIKYTKCLPLPSTRYPSPLPLEGYNFLHVYFITGGDRSRDSVCRLYVGFT